MIRRQLAKTCLLATIAGTTLFGSSTADAGVIPWVYDFVFGPARSSMSGYSGYHPGYSNFSSYQPHSTYYGPSYQPHSTYYGPSMDGVVWHAPSPFVNSGCLPCDSACPGGNCGVSTTTTAKPTPAPDDISKKKTFADGQTPEVEKAENSGFTKAKKPLGFAGGERTDGDAEIETRLATLEEQNKEIKSTLDQIRLSLEGLNDLKAQVNEIQKAQQKQEGFEPAKIGTPGANDPKTNEVPKFPPTKE
ncbi:MAG: hypothetical protein O3A00_03015 [Planctomycetota bacterium]|nr:hypothetical protein [Planctomycetota bacterium]